MADNETTIISDLPQITLDELTNDTLVPVENVDGTKAANLGQLRKKLNSTYVELVDVNLNDLKEDGFYECWGTTLNAPTSDVGAWIVQIATHENVTVQNVFGLGETTFSYMYRRRWNGVSWTAWENRILANETSIATKANASNTVTTNTNQTITGSKTFNNSNSALRTDVYISSPASDTNSWSGALIFKKGDLITGYCESLLNSGTVTKDALVQLTAHHIVNGTERYAHLGVGVRGNDGSVYATAPTPLIASNSNEITTTSWVKSLLSTSGQAYTWSNNQNGYIKFSNGFIIQWGYVGVPLVSHSRGTLTFPIPFSSILSISGNSRRSSGDAVSFAWFSNVTLTTAYWGFDYTGSGGSDGIDWIAVGF